MRLLDLFCGAGGASRGYAAAGFEVYGVDTDPHALRHYPYAHEQKDALEVLADTDFLDTFDVVAASPPCQAYSVTKVSHGRAHPDLVGEVLAALEGRVYVVENVPGAPLPNPMVLCGTMFGLCASDPATGTTLELRRHRLFESPVPLVPPGPCQHGRYPVGGVYGGGGERRGDRPGRGGYTPTAGVRRELMGLDVPRDLLSQAIPPTYTQWIGTQLIDYVALERP